MNAGSNGDRNQRRDHCSMGDSHCAANQKEDTASGHWAALSHRDHSPDNNRRKETGR